MDRDALYREVTEKHGAALGRLAAEYEAEPERRRELLREIHASIWKSLALFDQRVSLRTFVYRIAHNVGTAHLVPRAGVRFGRLDRQVTALYREGLDALVIAEITGLSPSNVALAVHRLEAASAPPRREQDLPTAFTIAELHERGVDGAAAETSRFLERLLVERRSEQLFRIAGGAALIPLVLLVRSAVEHARWVLPFLFGLIAGVLMLTGRQLLALGATTASLSELRVPELPRLRWQPSLGFVITASMIGTLGFPALLTVASCGERRADERRSEQAVGNVARCLDPRTTDPACVDVLGGQRMNPHAPIAQLPAAPDCRERRRAFVGTAELGSAELTLREAVSLGEACPDEVLLPAALLRRNLLGDLTAAARLASPVIEVMRALEASAPEKATLTSFDLKGDAAKITGKAENLADLAELTRRLEDIVRTPSGLGRVVERDGDGRVRVDLIAGADGLGFARRELRPLFPRVETTSIEGRPSPAGGAPTFEFVLTVMVNRGALPRGTSLYAPDALVEHYDAVTRANPENADAWLSLAYAHKARNKPADAIDAFKRYLELRPDAPARRQLENQIYLLGGQ